MEETENKQKIPNFNENKFLAKKNFIHELSQRKILFSEKVKLNNFIPVYFDFSVYIILLTKSLNKKFFHRI